MSSVSLVVAVLAAVVIVLALIFYVVTLTWAGRRRLGTAPGAAADGGTGPGTTGRVPAEGPSASLARGFSYLHVLPRSASRRPGVQHRLDRAFRRVDGVDPHASSRRIGEALLQAGLVEDLPAARATPAASAYDRTVWRD